MINNTVNGITKTLGIIGDPISHTFSPFIHNTISRKMDNNYIYIPFNVKKGMIADAIKGAYALNIQGMNVTVPYKKEVMPHLCGIDKAAEAAGAVNTLKYTENGYEGYNTDIIGVISTFKYADLNMSGENAIVLGAGGSACAAIIGLCEMGAGKIYIVNRTMETAKSLAKNIMKYYNIPIECFSYDDIHLIKDVEAIIQTTTLGFGTQKDLSPIKDKSIFNNILFVLDIIYTPWETVFMKDARGQGCKVVNGFDMLLFQAVASYEIWTGKKFDEKFVLDLKDEMSEFLFSS